MWTLTANFEGLSLTLQEQSAKKSTWVCLHTQKQGYREFCTL